uniref:F-box domain-containing protein n=1 Tax=Tanacetum cinerariifolium TaxID=118510 RepID=A0A6L2MCS1_TANCI|nr:hypothetical protein [Tanacetum cinerariifolium]
MIQCTRLESDQSRVDCKQEKEADKEDQIVIRSVKGNHDVKRLKLSPLPYSGYEYMLESDDVDSKRENEKDADEDESHLLNLPLYILSMVIEFSVGVEYLKFLSTCKRCYLAASLISWNNGKASKRLQEYSSLSPWGDVSTVTFDNLKPLYLRKRTTNFLHGKYHDVIGNVKRVLTMYL